MLFLTLNQEHTIVQERPLKLSKIQKNPRVRKMFVRNSGAEMGASILWTPGIFAFFLQKNLHVHKIPRFGGGYLVFFLGGVSADFIFMGAGIFLKINLKDRQRK